MAVYGSGTSPDQTSPNSLLGSAAFVNTNDLVVQYAPVMSLDMIRGQTGIESKYIIVDDAGIVGLFRYDSTDTTTNDNNATVLVTIDGRRYKALAPGRNGTTANRPATTGLSIGYQYYDTTLGKPIWWNGSTWKDAANATV